MAYRDEEDARRIDEDGPAMIELTAEVWLWNGETARWHFITIPEVDSAELRAQSLVQRKGFGSVRVHATINGVRWETSAFPQKSGGFILPVKAEIRRKAAVAAGDRVHLTLQVE